MRIHITGASGSGTTTLAKALAQKTGWLHFDSDDYFWLPTHPPYTHKRPPAERGPMIMHDLHSSANWVLSGCKANWADAPSDHLYDLVIFLFVPGPIRIQRLRRRETQMFGSEALRPGGFFHENHVEFIGWAKGYDNPNFEGRNITRHKSWLKSLSCPVLQLEGDCPLHENLNAIIAEIQNIDSV